MKRAARIIATIIIYEILALLIMIFVSQNGLYPSGSDVMYHVYRGDYVYHSLLNGNLWPLYNPMWYNGVELMRYWPPAAAYLMAGCQAMATGNAFYGYVVFVGLIFSLGAFSWAIIGVKHNRTGLGVFIGALWFFMPNNLYALFGEGNLPRALIMTVLPLFIMFVYDYLQNGKMGNMAGMIISFAFIVLCHAGYAGMIAISVLLFLITYRVICGTQGRAVDIIFGMLLSFMADGLYLYPSVKGGMVSGDSGSNTSSVMKGFFQSGLYSLNPLARLSSTTMFYFGLAAFLLALFGIIAAQKKAMPGFWTAVIIFAGTTSSAYPLLKALPGGQYLWMLRFISIALCMILFSFLQWKTLKRPFVILACILLVADTIPSLSLIYGNMSATTPQQRYSEVQKETLIAEAQGMTRQRIALMDGSTLGSEGAFLISDYGDSKAGAFGAGWEASVTAAQIVQVNQAMTDGDYRYMFDRLMMLGADTVIMKKSAMHGKGFDETDAKEAALACGYTQKDSNDEYILYHMDNITGTFGLISSYPGIAIGSAAADISRMFPSVIEMTDNYLDDYTYDELAHYKIVFLDHFMYHDLESAQNLVTKLSENGIRVVIYADGIPVDKNSQTQRFLGVECQPIEFHNGYPEFQTEKLGKISLDLFPKEYASWETVYVNGLDKVLGTAEDLDKKLAFYGTVKNDNITVVAFNLTFFYSLTHDPTLEQLLSEIVDTSTDTLPSHVIVPMSVTYAPDQITVQTPDRESLAASGLHTEQVNTTLSYHDIFSSDQKITRRGNLLYVEPGTTVIRLQYPYFKEGSVMSITGLVAIAFFLLAISKKYRKMNKAV